MKMLHVARGFVSNLLTVAEAAVDAVDNDVEALVGSENAATHILNYACRHARRLKRALGFGVRRAFKRHPHPGHSIEDVLFVGRCAARPICEPGGFFDTFCRSQHRSIESDSEVSKKSDPQLYCRPCAETIRIASSPLPALSSLL